MKNIKISTNNIIALVLLFVIITSPLVSAQVQTVGLFLNDTASFEGYTLFSEKVDTTVNLIDNYGRVIHSWHNNFVSLASLYLMLNGDLLRTTKFTPTTRGLQLLNWDGEVIWSYVSPVGTHHDFEPLPNGNILLLAFDIVSAATAIELGRDPALLSASRLKFEQILEIEPIYPEGGNIVWEWHASDHIIQDFDITKENYGIVEDHPELMDFNYMLDDNDDWLHANAVEYSPELDQIVISVRNINELWIIDHSTTTAEAAGHSGGNCNMGGDILYRWGNPQTYRAGTEGDQKLFLQHDVQWIHAGLPGEGNILMFNNHAGDPELFSTIDEIVPPLDGNCYPLLSPGTAFGPVDQTWVYTATLPTDFYSGIISGTQRLANGNTLICQGVNGHFYEVTSTGDIVWEYINPISNGNTTNQGDVVGANQVYRCTRYAPDYPGLAGRDLTPTSAVEIYDVTISGTQHSPSDVLASDLEIIITAEITAATAIVVAELHVDTGNGYLIETMYDDGLHNDGLADDNLYGVVLPQISESAFVQYYINAEESTGLSSLDPPNPPTTVYSFIVGSPCGVAPPVAIGSPDITVNTDAGVCGTNVSFFIDATDDCHGVTVAALPPSGSFFDIGITVVEVIATDISDFADTTYFSITVNDIEKPSVICPDDITVQKDIGIEGAVVDFDVVATDNCSSPIVVATHPSGSEFPIGITLVELVATDDALNADTCYFNVTVGCCSGETVGNMDGDPTPPVDMGDLTILIDMLFLTLLPIECLPEADVDLSGAPLPEVLDIDMGDLTILIDHLFLTLAPLPACP